MKCSRCIELLSDLAGDELGADLAAATREHLRGCSGCAARFEELSATVSLLRRLGDEPLPDDFGAALHRKLVAAGPPPHPGRVARLRAWLSGGALGPAALGAVGAAAVAAVLVGTHHRAATSPAHVALQQAPQESVAAGPVVPIFRVPQAKLAVVRIDFVAEQAVDDVEFAVTLPEGLHFVSEGKELPDREFRWRGRLERGSNPIPVAVRGDHAGRFPVAARAIGSDVDAHQKVLLEVIPG
jgi:hypothetical protein